MAGHALVTVHRPLLVAAAPRGHKLIPSCVAGKRKAPPISLSCACSLCSTARRQTHHRRPPSSSLSPSKIGRSTPSMSSTRSTYSKLKPPSTTPAQELPSSAIFLCETAPLPAAFRHPPASPTTPRAPHGLTAPLRPGVHRRLALSLPNSHGEPSVIFCPKSRPPPLGLAPRSHPHRPAGFGRGGTGDAKGAPPLFFSRGPKGHMGLAEHRWAWPI
jgi:hypothetical protein